MTDCASRSIIWRIFSISPFVIPDDDEDEDDAEDVAADALWVGVPLLTQIGETFAGRVAASQLSALGMPELIVNTQDEYFAKALELATQPQLLQEIRAKQWSNRLTSPLFNTKQYVKDLEELFYSLLEQKS